MKFLDFFLAASFVSWSGEGIQVRKDYKIQDGENVTDIARFPFIGLFTSFIEEGTKICTGILVDQFSAITAGHCVLVDSLAKPYRLLPLKQARPNLVMGVINTTNVHDPFYQKRDIKQLFIHPKAEFSRDPPFTRYDMGAMKWHERMVLNAKIQLTPLIPEKMIPARVFNSIIDVGGHCEMPGWGALQVKWSDPNEELEWPETLQVFATDIISKYDCCAKYFPENYNYCMKSLGVAVSGCVCHIRHKVNTSVALGDSGSPLYCPYKGKKYVVGINAAGASHYDPGFVEIYAPAYFVIDVVMRPYIKNITGNHSAFSQSHKRSADPLGSVQILVMAWILGNWNMCWNIWTSAST